MKGYNHKTCVKCKVVKPLLDFRYADSKKLRRRTDCKECETAYKKLQEYKDKQREYSKRKRSESEDYRLKQLEYAHKKSMTPKGRAKRLWLAARHRAKVNDLQFSVTEAFIEHALVAGVCVRTGIPFDLSRPNKTNHNPYAPSIDKIDPFGDYTNDNIQVVCNIYNLGKGQLSDVQFIAFCKQVVTFHA